MTAVETAADTVADTAAGTEAETDFAVHLDVFDGPFDLLLGLIARHQLDITEVALSQVTDEFVAYVRRLGPDLDKTTSFLVVAATLLDLKTAQLLPQAGSADPEDLERLEARDLLFARLLQYRAFTAVAAFLSQRLSAESRRRPRAVKLDERFTRLLPEVVLGVGADGLAALAARAMVSRPAPVVPLAHLHAPMVSVREQAAVLVSRLRGLRHTTFRTLVSDAPDTVTTVARFLALLELHGAGLVGFEQLSPLAELHVRWTGRDEAVLGVGEQFDHAWEGRTDVDG